MNLCDICENIPTIQKTLALNVMIKEGDHAPFNHYAPI